VREPYGTTLSALIDFAIDFAYRALVSPSGSSPSRPT
jgi:hypothetical protein